MLRFETHTHTKEGSACGGADAAEMVRACKQAGYDGLFITDHFYHGNTAVDRDLPWKEWVRQFCLGYEHARAEGEKIGMTVCFGWEYSWEGCDFLTYGLPPAWLAQHPETITLPPKTYLQLVRDAGGCVVHAHPFREAGYIPVIKLVPDTVDGVEIWNGGNRRPEMNDRAKWYAESYHLPVTAGSDAHKPDDFTGGILLSRPLTCTEEFPAFLRNGWIDGLICQGKDFYF